MSDSKTPPRRLMSASERLRQFPPDGIDPEEEARFARLMQSCRELRQDLSEMQAEVRFDLAVLNNGGAGHA